MEFTITSSPDFVIRSLTTAAEIEAFYWLNAQEFLISLAEGKQAALAEGKQPAALPPAKKPPEKLARREGAQPRESSSRENGHTAVKTDRGASSSPGKATLK